MKTNPASRVQQALKFMRKRKVTAYRAAQEFQLSPSAVYRAITAAHQKSAKELI